MPPKYHAGWEKYGFIKVYDEQRPTIVVKARCPVCGYASSKKTEDYMRRHIANHQSNQITSQEMNEHEVLREIVENIEQPTTSSNSECSVQALQSKGKKRSLESAHDSQDCLDEKLVEINTHLVKFFVCNGLDISAAGSVHLKNFCNILLSMSNYSSSEYPIFSAEKLKISILPNVYKGIVSKNQKKQFAKVLFIEENNSFKLSYISVKAEESARNSSYVYILCKKNDEQTFESFCADSLDKAYRFYGAQIEFIFTNSENDTEFKILYEFGSCTVVVCLSKLLQKLEHDIEPFRMSDLSQSHAVTSEYLQCLSDIKSKIVNYSLGEATKLIYEMKMNNDFSLNESLCEIVDQFMKPLHQAAMFFNHKYQMDFLAVSEQQSVLDYIDETLNRCAEDTRSISDYLLKTSDFKRLFEKSDFLNPHQF